MAWAMKESLRRLWDYTYLGAARTFFRAWYWWVTHSRLAPMINVAHMLKAHLENILTYLTHRVTNAMTEGLNAKIQWIKYASRGYRDADARLGPRTAPAVAVTHSKVRRPANSLAKRPSSGVRLTRLEDVQTVFAIQMVEALTQFAPSQRMDSVNGAVHASDVADLLGAIRRTWKPL
jgi:hypothetical protein